MGLQAALRLIYPPLCIACDGQVATEFGLCTDCWQTTPFIGGAVCDCCGAPLPGEDDGRAAQCDDCLTLARPWSRGRAALQYRDTARQLVMALKHADRLDLAVPAAQWLMRAASPLIAPDTVIAPVPLHWLRMVRRKYNQSAVLAQALARQAGRPACPDLLIRHRNTRSQEGRDRDGRFRNVEGAFRVRPGRDWVAAGRPVLLVDDVMTSGATLSACTEACLAAGAARVDVVVLCRVAKEA
ncbi:amidophosphoribosyltransferase [Gemmobacter aquaticus]|uniref:Amidophosphoribosyltransferase n=1 Tax=Gemmobacter aquaticus TaxID=490185 RepID=A0A917YLH5_9RHOB|nr:ComF family protein [Gemmobacter aquaticus]GGO33663.1 amidophosphoribosyltransferase [Gemmobacter aquaticus]